MLEEATKAIYISSPAEFRAAWEDTYEDSWEFHKQLGSSRPLHLVRVSSAGWVQNTLSAFRIPQVTKQFLVEAGLPCSGPVSLYFDDLGTGLFTLQELVEQEHLPEDLTEYLCIGRQGYRSDICIEEFTGRVMSIMTHDGCVKKEFVNKDVLSFAKTLLICFRLFILGYARCASELWEGTTSFHYGFYGTDFDFVAARECMELVAFFDPEAVESEETFWGRCFAGLSVGDW